MNGVICLSVGFMLFRLFAYLPSVALEGIVMALELLTIRLDEIAFTFKNDKKLFITNMTVIVSMLFTRPSNAFLIGLFVYLAILAKELMVPQSEVTSIKIRTFKNGDGQNNTLSKSSKLFF